MIGAELAFMIVISLTIVVIAELIRRYYMAKFEYEYKTAQLRHYEKYAADGGEPGAVDVEFDADHLEDRD